MMELRIHKEKIEDSELYEAGRLDVKSALVSAIRNRKNQILKSYHLGSAKVDFMEHMSALVGRGRVDLACKLEGEFRERLKRVEEKLTGEFPGKNYI